MGAQRLPEGRSALDERRLANVWSEIPVYLFFPPAGAQFLKKPSSNA